MDRPATPARSNARDAITQNWAPQWEGVRQLLAYGTVFAAVLYAYGWILVTRFYNSFGITPEEAGFGFGELTVRVGVMVGLIVLIASGLSWMVFRSIVRVAASGGGSVLADQSVSKRSARAMFRRGLHTDASEMFGPVSAMVALVVGGGVGDLLNGTLPDVPQWFAGLTVGVLAGFAFVGLIAFVVGATATVLDWVREHPTRPRRIANRAVSAVGVLTVALLVFGLWLLPERLAAEVIDDGNEMRLGWGGLVVLRVEQVEVFPTHAGGAIDHIDLRPGTCVHYLGSNGATSVVYHSSQAATVRIPTESVAFVRPCS